MISCSDLLREYSEYRDGVMSPSRADAVELHLAECPACARHHQAIAWGVDELRTLSSIEPSEDFLPRLQHRIYHIDEDEARWNRGDSSGVSLPFVIGVILLFGGLAWVPVLRREALPIQLPPVAAVAPPEEELPALFREGPLLLPRTASALESNSNDLFFRYTQLGSYANYQRVSTRLPR